MPQLLQQQRSCGVAKALIMCCVSTNAAISEQEHHHQFCHAPTRVVFVRDLQEPHRVCRTSAQIFTPPKEIDINLGAKLHSSHKRELYCFNLTSEMLIKTHEGHKMTTVTSQEDSFPTREGKYFLQSSIILSPPNQPRWL